MAKIINILLVSEDFVRSQCVIDDNLSGKYLLPAIREAQEIELQEIVGSALLTKLKELVAAKMVGEEGNELYADLLALVGFYLAYQAAARLPMKVSYKVANKGVVKTSDEKVTNATYSEVIAASNYNQAIADSHAHRVQLYLWNNRTKFPELSECDCRRIKSNLYSSATCGIVLGGARGKVIPRR